MKLSVKHNKKTCFWLWLPNSLMKSRLGIRFLIENGGKYGIPNVDPQRIHTCAKDAYAQLKKYVKTYGHFTFVDVKSDGYHITIKI